jgi:hypothetical protein
VLIVIFNTIIIINILLNITYAGCTTILNNSMKLSTLERPPVMQPCKNFPALQGILKFITAFKRALYQSSGIFSFINNDCTTKYRPVLSSERAPQDEEQSNFPEK